ncbi:MAG TPA: carboxypeptidase-like regulatory domain-containing protein [Terriglobales bacterium]|nr:carboxypeptidase-like regulatory domain-containing protein [Terriglobales bacterium]
MRLQHRWLRTAVVVVTFALLVSVASAQSDKGTLSGTVLDPSGAVVPNATVTATGTQTGAVYTAVTTSSGAYRIPNISVGTYNVKVVSSGFKTAESTGVVIQVNTVASLDISLTIGTATDVTTVSADAPSLQTESADIGTVVSTKQIQDLPIALNSTGQSFLRSAETFVFLTPGTAGPGTNSDASSSGIFESKLGGGQNFATEVILDGVSTQRADSGSAFDQTAPSVEALQEFKVTTSTIPADFGRTSGGLESFTTKSGTNHYHGTIFDLYRNDKLDANSWNNNFNKVPKPRDHQNDFGGSLGGPVWIPKLYNGKDKLFFFFSWEQYRNNQGTSNTTTLPTDAERNGDFSAVLGAPLTSGGNPVINPCDGSVVRTGQIFDPATTTTVGGVPCRTAFAGNIIPANRISAVAKKVLGFVPLANRASDCGIICNNYQLISAKEPRDTTMTVKVDMNVSEKGKAFFSYSSRDQEVLNGNPVLPPPLDPNFFNSNFTHYLRFGYDYAISPTLLNNFVVGLNRLANFSKGQSITGVDWDQELGISGASGQVFPQFSFSGSPVGAGYQGLSAANDDRNVPNSFVLSDGVSWVRGRHSFRFGFEWRSFQFSRVSQANTSPAYEFQNFQTAFNANGTTTGDPFASFLLGAPNKESLSINLQQPRWASNYYATYIQDDFKVHPDLMVNLGLRWSVDTPRHESSGAQSVLDLTANNPLSPGTPGALIYGRGATGAQTYYRNFGPRFGFSYAPEKMFGLVANTVLRGGYSIYYAPLQYSDFGSSLTAGTTASPVFQSPDSFTPVQSPDAGFPAFPPPSNAKDPTLFTGTDSSPSYVAPSYGRPGMVQNWSLEIQHELAKDLILDIGYVGMHSTRLRSNLLQVNSLNPQFYPLGNDLNLDVTDPKAQADLATLGVTVPSWFVPLWSPNGEAKLGQLLRPHPQYRNIDSSVLENAGQSTYNALQAKLERRFRNGLNLLAAYTFSKTLTNADSSFPTFTGFNSNVFGAQNAYNLKAEKSVSYQDVPHAFVLSYLYELPVGPGKKYLSHGVASRVLGGWQVGGVHRYQSGVPVMINAFASSNPYANGNFRYSQIPGVPLISPNASHFDPFGADSGCTAHNDGTFTANSSNNYFNCAALLDPNAPDLVAARGYAFGNLPVFFSGIRTPHFFNEDFSIIKRTLITEGQALTVKVDIPNAFNRHTFGQLDGNPTDSVFGVPGGGSHSVLNAPRRIQFTFRYEF